MWGATRRHFSTAFLAKSPAPIMTEGFDGEDDWYVFVFVARQFSGRLGPCDEGDLSWIPDRHLMSLPLWESDRIFMKWLKGKKSFQESSFTKIFDLCPTKYPFSWGRLRNPKGFVRWDSKGVRLWEGVSPIVCLV